MKKNKPVRNVSRLVDAGGPKVIFKSPDLLVIDKPADLVSDGTAMFVWLKKEDAALAKLERHGLVHRLDRDTSGLMLIARTREAQRKLKEAFKEREIKKTYIALLDGILEPEEGIIRMPIHRHRKGKKMVVTGTKGRESETQYKVKKYLGDKYTFLEAYPKTGRTHQIRVHFSAIRFPVVGDKLYGGPAAGLSRQFLHATKIRIPKKLNLKTRGIISWSSPMADDLKKFLNEAR